MHGLLGHLSLENASSDLKTYVFYVVLIPIDVAKTPGEGVTGVECQYGSTAGEPPKERMQTSFAI